MGVAGLDGTLLAPGPDVVVMWDPMAALDPTFGDATMLDILISASLSQLETCIKSLPLSHFCKKKVRNNLFLYKMARIAFDRKQGF